MGELSEIGKILEYGITGMQWRFKRGEKPESGNQRFQTIQGRYNTLKGRMQKIKKWAPWKKKGYNLDKELSFAPHAEFVQQKSAQYLRVARNIGKRMGGLKNPGFIQKKSKWTHEWMAEIGKILEYGMQGMKWGTTKSDKVGTKWGKEIAGPKSVRAWRNSESKYGIKNAVKRTKLIDRIKAFRAKSSRGPVFKNKFVTIPEGGPGSGRHAEGGQKLKPGQYKNRTGQVRSMGRPPRGTKLMGSGRNWFASFSKTINTYNKRRSADKGMYEGGPGSGRKPGGTHIDQNKVMRKDRAVMIKHMRKAGGTKRTLWNLMHNSQTRFPKLVKAIENLV